MVLKHKTILLSGLSVGCSKSVWCAICSYSPSTASMHKDTSTSLGLNFISLYKYISSMYVQAAKALPRQHGCKSSSESQLVD